MTHPSRIKVLIWKVSSEYVKDHPHHNPHGLHYTREAPPVPVYVYAHTRQIDWSAMHAACRHAPQGG